MDMSQRIPNITKLALFLLVAFFAICIYPGISFFSRVASPSILEEDREAHRFALIFGSIVIPLFVTSIVVLYAGWKRKNWVRWILWVITGIFGIAFIYNTILLQEIPILVPIFVVLAIYFFAAREYDRMLKEKPVVDSRLKT